MIRHQSASASASRRFRSKVTLIPVVALIFFSVSGGAYGLEPLTSTSGPGMAMILILVTPLIYALPVALFTAELGTALPTEGGGYHWVQRAFGDFWGFQEGMLWIFTAFVDMALYPLLFADYLGQLWHPAAQGATVIASVGSIHIDLHWILAVSCFIIPLTALNVVGAKWVGDSSVLFAVIALLPFVLLAAFGLPQLFSHHVNPVAPLTTPHTSALAAFGAGLWIVMWNYCGFDSVGAIAEEIERPQRVIPRALAVSLIVIVAAYVFPMLAAMAAGGWSSWDAGSFTDIARTIGGPWLAWAITAGAIVGAVGLFGSLLMSNSRIPFAMAEDAWLPRSISRLSPRFGTPTLAIVGCAVIYSLFSFSTFANLVVIDVFLTNCTILLELAALFALRRKEPDLPRPDRIPGGTGVLVLMAIPLVAVCAFAVWAQVNDSGTISITYSFGAVGLSVLLYLVARLWRRRTVGAIHGAELVATRSVTRTMNRPGD